MNCTLKDWGGEALILLKFHFHLYENKDDKFLSAIEGVFEKRKENKAEIGR